MRIHFTIYQIIQIITLPFIAIYLIIRKIKRKPVFGSLIERIGIIPKTKTNNTIWFHAVSVGEVLSIQSIIEKIKLTNPNATCYLTVGTLTGKKIALEKLKADIVSFLPYDLLPFMLLAYKRIKPKKIVIVEAEIWPNLLMLAYFKKIPITLINARVSKRSKKKYHMLKPLLLPLFNLFKKIYTQSAYDKKEFESFGVNKSKLEVLGDIKAFNVLAKQKKLPSQTRIPQTLLVGSLHPGELDIYLELYARLKYTHPELKLTLAPRHFHWRKELISKVKSTGYSFGVWDESIKMAPRGHDILLVCKLGELFTLYPQASLYFLGGTFVPIGGHNLLEPAVWATPTIVGPCYHNCNVIAKELLQKDGLICVKNKEELYINTKKLLEDSSKRELLGENSRLWLESKAKIIEDRLKSIFS